MIFNIIWSKIVCYCKIDFIFKIYMIDFYSQKSSSAPVYLYFQYVSYFNLSVHNNGVRVLIKKSIMSYYVVSYRVQSQINAQ